MTQVKVSEFKYLRDICGMAPKTNWYAKRERSTSVARLAYELVDNCKVRILQLL